MTKLEELVKCISGKHVYIQTHNYPDPDAISSGFGLKYLLKNYGIDSTLCYGGTIDRVSTKTMIKIFDIDLVNVKEIEPRDNEDEIILVDTQYTVTNVDVFGGQVIAAIDHHWIVDKINSAFEDNRESVGSCAAIIASYFYDNDIDMPENIAGALLYGINVDTANMTRDVAKLDLDMFYNLYQIADYSKIKYLENNTIQVDDLQTYAEAINSVQIIDNIGFANAGMNCTKSLVAAISDFVLNIADVNFCVVYSIGEEGIRLSARSAVKGLHSAQILIDALDNIGTCGGHSSMAGGFVPVDEVSGMSNDATVNTIVYRTMQVIKNIIQNNKIELIK